MITRQRMPNGHVTVTFQIPHDTAASSAVVGDFNGWSREVTPMHPTAAGLQATVLLAPGRSYRFRYLLDDDRWVNDWQADGYVDNDYGGSDSVLDLTELRE